MRKVLVSILSEHLIPNYLFIKEMKGKFEQHLFISTDYIESKNIGEHLEDALYYKKRKRVERVIVDNDNYHTTIAKLSKHGLSDKDEYIINLTGGTKIMSIAVHDFFQSYKSHFYYVPISKNTYYDFDKKASSPLSYRITLIEYFTLYGLKFDCDNNLIKKQDYTLNYFEDIKKGKYPPLSTTFVKKQKNSELKRYYSGSWFEEYTYLRLKKELNLGDNYIAMSLKIYRDDLNKNDNELDVVFVYENTLYVIECKVSMKGKPKKKEQDVIVEHMYKLASVSKDFGLKVYSYLFTLHNLNELKKETLQHIHKRAQILGINKIITMNELKEDKINL